MGIFHFFWVQGADAAMWIRAAFAEFLLQRCHGDSENFRYLLVGSFVLEILNLHG